MRVVVTLALAAVAVIPVGISAYARVQPQMYCWAGDAEFPVACDPEEEEENNRAILPPKTMARTSTGH